MINITELCYSYKSNLNILNNISLSISEGEIFFLIGANGAGKSTLLKNILGLVRPDSGVIMIDNVSINSETRLELMRRIGVLLEGPSFYKYLTVLENIQLIGAYYGVADSAQIAETIKAVGLENAQDKKAGELSTGFKQRLGLALSIVHKPKFVFLDEPTNGLDPQNIREFRELILSLNQRLGVGFFITTHILSEVEKLATRAAIIRRGTIIDDFNLMDLPQKLLAFGSGTISNGGLEEYYHLKCNEYDGAHPAGVR